MGHVLWPLYDGKVGLSLLAGPANAGKVALLLERYLARLDDEPVLIVPNASDVDRVERDLLARHGCLFSGEIVTFDRLFELLVRDDPDRRPVATDHQRALIVRRAVGGATLNGLTALRAHERVRRRAAADARRARVRPARPVGPGRRPGQALRRLPRRARPARALGSRPAAPARRRATPVRPRCVARRARLRVRVRGPDERRSGRCSRRSRGAPTCRSRSRTSRGVRCSRRCSAPPTISRRSRPGASRSCRLARPSTRIPHSRTSSARSSASRPPLRRRSTAPCASSRAPARAARWSSIGEEMLGLLRAGTPAEQIALVAPALDGWRAPLETVLGGLGVPCSFESRVRLGNTPFGHALLQLLRYAWTGRDPARAVRVSPLAVLGPRALVRRLRRGAPARTRDPQPGARRGGDREAA